jgi:hypothetical protein
VGHEKRLAGAAVSKEVGEGAKDLVVGELVEIAWRNADSRIQVIAPASESGERHVQ